MTKCTRCEGLMVEDHFLDFEGTAGHMWTTSYRCMNCGNVYDSVIEQHRLARPTPVLVAASSDFTDLDDDVLHEGPSQILRAA